MPQPNQITPAQLMRLIGTPECPALIDVRLPEDLAHDPRLVPGSFPLSHDQCDPAPVRLLGQRVVVICAKGRKLSEGAAALLRLQGIAAEVLEGGSVGWAAANLPMVPIPSLPTTNLWVTRHRPKIDRIACPWAIRRFIDPTARFLFVAPAEVPAVAERFNAIPFDIEGVKWSHRGETCTFDTMIAEWGLATGALLHLAKIVRAADTARLDLAPEAAGLLAASLGLSRIYSDDLAQLDAGMALYDAFYRWCRDATDETHNWPTNKAKP